MAGVARTYLDKTSSALTFFGTHTQVGFSVLGFLVREREKFFCFLGVVTPLIKKLFLVPFLYIPSQKYHTGIGANFFP
jgi:hypothetical protein